MEKKGSACKARLIFIFCVVAAFIPHCPLRVSCYETAAPWIAPAGTSFKYSGLENDLSTLLSVQASEHRWITMVTMTAKIKRFVLNCIYSLIKYGEHPHYITAVFDDASLAECKRLNLPCFNASTYSTIQIVDGDHGFHTQISSALWWAKQRLSMAILKEGFHIHGSDVDVVYFRNFNLSYDRIFSNTQADGIFAAEESGPVAPHQEWEPVPPEKKFVQIINAGVYAVRSNNRSLEFFRRWIEYPSVHGPSIIDQVALNNLQTRAYFFCDSHGTCRSVQGQGYFALYRHAFFFPGTSCITGFVPPWNMENRSVACAPHQLYIHFLCGCCWEEKTAHWDRNSMWFIDRELQPIYEDGGGSHGKHPYMPCKDNVAWPQWNIYS